MNRTVYWFSISLFAFALDACSSGQNSELLSLKVKHSAFFIQIPAFGELQSVTPTPLVSPANLRGRQTIAWMVPDNSRVKAGETVIRLNNAAYLEQIKTEEGNIAKINLEISQKESQMQKEKSDIEGQIGVTSVEKELAEIYSARDESIYSRNKIIEDGIDRDYLNEKEKHYQKKGTKIAHKINTELRLLLSRKNAIQTKLDQYNETLKALEIKAPHDGLLVIEKRWNGEKYRIGMDIWYGEKIATLPDLENMQAKVFVLESEASGLKEQLPVSLTIDFEPSKIIHGRVSGIDTIAKAHDENSPLKYFEVKVSFEKTDTRIMKPGVQCKATIAVAALQDVICVPNQALFFEQGKAFLHVRTSHAMIKRAVEIGLRSLTQTVIQTGVSAGDEVLLGDPQAGK